jgi:hypothetical protein
MQTVNAMTPAHVRDLLTGLRRELQRYRACLAKAQTQYMRRYYSGKILNIHHALKAHEARLDTLLGRKRP